MQTIEERRLKELIYERKWTKKNPEKIKEYSKRSYLKNSEKIKANRRVYDLKNKEKIKEHELSISYRYSNLKSTARKENKEYNITKEEYTKLINKGCYYCNTSLLKRQGCSLDRIDNSKGYIIDNVLPCCGFCNYLRGNRLTVEETKVAIDAILKYRLNKSKEVMKNGSYRRSS